MADKTPIDMVKHKDRRTNIPTEELRDFVAEDEKSPKTLLYPRDPSLDPQLVWKGKDEQDSADLAVESLPVYIQEKVSVKSGPPVSRGHRMRQSSPETPRGGLSHVAQRDGGTVDLPNQRLPGQR